jgi:hypothetical protein
MGSDRFSRGAIARWGERAGQGGARLRYAEKVPVWAPARVRQAMPCDVVVLVRDPRDVFVSIAAFDAKRRFAGFSRRPEDDDWTFARRWVALCADSVGRWRRELPADLAAFFADELRAELACFGWA